MLRLLIGAPPECNHSGSSVKSRWLFIVCFLVISLVQHSRGQIGKVVELRREILSHYNKSIAPSFENTPTDVGISFFSIRIRQFDESAGRLTVEGYMILNWMDNRLSWNDPKYKNITWFPIRSSNIWLPKTSVFTGGRAEHLSNNLDNVACQHSGKVWRRMTTELHPTCTVEDLRWYPNEIHTCTISMGSLYPLEMGDFLIGQWQRTMMHGAYWEKESKSPHWDLLNLEHREAFTSTGTAILFLTDEFIFTIRRQGRQLVATFLTLMMWCTFLSWSSFVLPLNGKQLTQRLSVAFTSLFLSSTSFLVLISTMHSVGQNPPIIVKVNLCVVILAFLSSLHTIFLSRATLKSTAHLNVLQKLPVSIQYLLGLRRETAGDGNSLLANMESPPESVQENFQKDVNAEGQTDLVETAYDRAHLILQLAVLAIVITFLCLL